MPRFLSHATDNSNILCVLFSPFLNPSLSQSHPTLPSWLSLPLSCRPFLLPSFLLLSVKPQFLSHLSSLHRERELSSLAPRPLPLGT